MSHKSIQTVWIEGSFKNQTVTVKPYDTNTTTGKNAEGKFLYLLGGVHDMEMLSIIEMGWSQDIKGLGFY